MGPIFPYRTDRLAVKKTFVVVTDLGLGAYLRLTWCLVRKTIGRSFVELDEMPRRHAKPTLKSSSGIQRLYATSKSFGLLFTACHGCTARHEIAKKRRVYDGKV